MIMAFCRIKVLNFGKDNSLTNLFKKIVPVVNSPLLDNLKCFHTHSGLFKGEPQMWPRQNKMVYPPLKPGEPRRPAWVCHFRSNIKYSPKKMWYIACLVRGMSVDEAIKQLSFVPKKGAIIAKEVIQEAQELAVAKHNVEFKTNMWVAESYVGRGLKIKGMRKHARTRFGVVEYRYCHYFVRLVEGPPPKHYYRAPLTGHEQLQEYFDEMRSRKILHSL